MFTLALVPLVRIAVGALTGGLGGNPVEAALHRTGWWALAFLMLTLAVTPVRRITGIGWLVKLRRMLGLSAQGVPGSWRIRSQLDHQRRP